MSSARDTDFSDYSFKETVSYYDELRKLLFDEVRKEHPQYGFSAITLRDAQVADTWRHSDPRKDREKWSWIDAYRCYNRKSEFKRFELSVSSAGNLVGLSFGGPTASKTKLKIDIIEATPIEEHKRNTQVFQVISTAAQYYAVLLGANEVRIVNPLNSNLVDYYCSYGYEFISNNKPSIPNYCALKVGD